MECISHDGKPAIGICQFCGRGVCRACKIETSEIIACSEECARASNFLRKSIERMVQNSLRVTLILVKLLWAAGVVFLLCGSIEAFAGRAMLAAFLFLIGSIFVASGFAFDKSARSGG